MRGPSLHATTVLSVALHLAFFSLAALILRHSQKIIMTSPYEVSIVGPSAPSRASAPKETTAQEQSITKRAEVREINKLVKDKDTKEDAKRLEDRLAELASKKKVERIVRARKMITIGGQTASLSKKLSQRTGTVAGTGSPGGGTYEDLIASHIGQEIVFPETGESQLETIVLVKIRKDGEIIIQNIEKRSGNALFDRAALRAIEKANPVPPPPAEMEIGLKLYPYGTRK